MSQKADFGLTQTSEQAATKRTIETTQFAQDLLLFVLLFFICRDIEYNNSSFQEASIKRLFQEFFELTAQMAIPSGLAVLISFAPGEKLDFKRLSDPQVDAGVLFK